MNDENNAAANDAEVEKELDTMADQIVGLVVRLVDLDVKPEAFVARCLRKLGVDDDDTTIAEVIACGQAAMAG